MAEHLDEWANVPTKKLRETLATLTTRYNAPYMDDVRQQIRAELARRGEPEEES